MYEYLKIFPRGGVGGIQGFINNEKLENPIPELSEHPDNPVSFGKDFNLIRAVQEYGPQRITSIDKELLEIQKRVDLLTTERSTLERLVEAVLPPRRNPEETPKEL